MEAVILAAGKGTRTYPLTHDRPKSLLPVAGQYLIDWQLNALAKAGVEKVVIVVGWGKDKLLMHLRRKKASIDVVVATQDSQLGTAHAIRAAEKHIKGDFLCVNGDVLFDHAEISEMHKKYDSNVVCAYKVDDISRYGEVITKNGMVTKVREKPKIKGRGLANAGVYLFKKNIFAIISELKPSLRGEYEITDALTLLAKNGELHCYELNFWIEIGYPWDLLSANEHFLKSLAAFENVAAKSTEVMQTRTNDLRSSMVLGKIEDGATLHGPVAVGEGTVIRAGSYIEGPVVIGNNCKVGPNCYIRPYTAIYSNCKVGNAVEVKNSIIMSNSNIPHHNYVGDSVIGENCNLGSGTKIANLRLDNAPVICTVRGEKINTKRRKLGAILGHGVKTGINASIDPGTIIGQGTFIGPGARAYGTIGPYSIIQ